MINIAFKVPVIREKAETNNDLREFMEAIVLVLTWALTDEDKNQNLLVTLCHCDRDPCPSGFPHLIDTIDSEKKLSEEFMLNFATRTGVDLVQNEKRIVVNYKE